MAEIIPFDKLTGHFLVKEIKAGKVFVYPTDTIYGLGCDATNEESVERIKKIKKRSNKPFSIIAPSKEWILDNYEVNKSYIQNLPGPYTLILKKKNSTETTGIRIPSHPLTPLIQKSNVPFITTSVNISGEKPITNIREIPLKIKRNIDFIINAGILDNPPSILIDLTGSIPKILKR